MEKDSSTSAVLDPKEAEPTSGKSPLPPEGSPAKEGDKKPAEKLPIEGKSSQEPPPPDDSEGDDPEPEKGKDVPHAQWLRMKTSRNKYRDTVNALSELGINSKEDAATLLREAEIAESEAREQGAKSVSDWISQEPEQFVSQVEQNQPEVFLRLQRTLAPGVLAGVAEWVRAKNPEGAKFLVDLAATFERGARESPKRTSEADERLSKERQTIEGQKQKLFDRDAIAEVNGSLRRKVTDLIKGLEFSSDDQRELLLEQVASRVKQALNGNALFTRDWAKLWNVSALDPDELDARHREVVALHSKHITDQLLREAIEKERNRIGIGLAQKKPDGNGERREVTGSGSPPRGGKITPEAKESLWNDLSKKFSGERLDIEYSKGLSRLRAGS